MTIDSQILAGQREIDTTSRDKGTNSWEASRLLGTPLVMAGTGNDMLGFVPGAAARVAPEPASDHLGATADAAQAIQA